MPRIPYPPAESFPPELPGANMLRMWSHSVSTLRPGLALGTACISKISLPKYNRELLTLYCSVKFKSEYIWTRHVDGASKNGVTERQLQALKQGDIYNHDIWNEKSMAFLAFLDDVIDHPVATDDTFDEARRWFDDKQMVEMVTAQVRWFLVFYVLLLTITGFLLHVGSYINKLPGRGR